MKYPPAEPVVPWKRFWEYAEWKEATLKGRYAGEQMLEMLYSKEWDPDACHEYMAFANLFKQAPKEKPAREPKPVAARRRVLGMDVVQKRIALAIWQECGKLMGRPLTPDARAFVLQTFDSAKQVVFVNEVEKFAAEE